MVSKTSKTTTIRANKKIKAGRKRKNSLSNHGSTLPQELLFGSKEAADEPKAAKA